MDNCGIQIPEKFQGLFEPKRYKVYYGGRGGAKSHTMARALLLKGAMEKTRILCAREIQGSIKDSVHKLLSDIIFKTPQLKAIYTVQKDTIFCQNGTEIFFKGLKHNIMEVKSTEGIDICWVEEAVNVSDDSWEILIPTIRKAGSEIWVSFNPVFDDDPTYIRFVTNADDDCVVEKVFYYDNPFHNDVLEKERLKLKKNDPAAYKHIWLGDFDDRAEGFIFANYLKIAREDGRITSVPHKAGVPVFTAWDLGKKHATVIWFAQKVGEQVRIIDYHECYGDDTDLPKIAKHLRSKDYEYSMHYIPHDGKHNRMGMSASISNQLREIGIKNSIVPSTSITARISKGKELLYECLIDEEKTKEGLRAMKSWHYEYDAKKNRFKDSPFDDWSQDASDAFTYLSLIVDKEKNETYNKPTIPSAFRSGNGNIWCG